MRIIAVRHGETEGNILHLVQSHSPGVLSANGVQQAHDAAELLRDEMIDMIYSSDLQRCVDTAHIIAKYHQAVPLTLHQRLRERDQGLYEGRHWEEVPFEDYEGEFLDRPMPGGESWRDVERRIELLLDELYAKHADQTVVLVTHGGVVKALRAALTEMTLRESIDERVHNASVHVWEMHEPVRKVNVQ